MDQNSILLSGNVSRGGVNEMKFGPMGWLRVAIQPIKVNEMLIPQHEIFVGMDLKGMTEQKVEKNRELFKKVEDGGFIVMWDCLLDSYSKHGESKVNRRVKAGLSRHMMGKAAGVPLNLAHFAGKVTKFLVAGGHGWAELQCAYVNPKAEKGTPWPTRSVKILLPGNTKELKVGHNYFIAGKLSGKNPSGNDDLLIVATVVHAA